MLTCLAFAVGGCADVADDIYMDAASGELSPADLEARPSLGEAVYRYESLMESVRSIITTNLQGAEVIRTSDGERGGCTAQVASTDLADKAHRFYLPTWAIQARPTKEQWGQIRGQLEPLLEQHQFSNVTMDAPIGAGGHRLVVQDDFGAELAIGYDKAMGLSLKSGCHLDEK